MNKQYHSHQRKPIAGTLRQAAEELGGAPLAGSGFEDETPEDGFREDGPTSRSFPQE
jgi:hypothetical protein